MLEAYNRAVTFLRGRGCKTPEDYVSEAMTVYLEQGEPEVDSLSKWLYRVAWYKWVNERRSLRSRKTVSGDARSTNGSDGDPFEVEDHRGNTGDLTDEMVHFVSTLESPLRETAVLLSKCDSGQQVGEALGITRQAVNLRLSKIRQRFDEYRKERQ